MDVLGRKGKKERAEQVTLSLLGSGSTCSWAIRTTKRGGGEKGGRARFDIEVLFRESSLQGKKGENACSCRSMNRAKAGVFRDRGLKLRRTEMKRSQRAESPGASSNYFAGRKRGEEKVPSGTTTRTASLPVNVEQKRAPSMSLPPRGREKSF